MAVEDVRVPPRHRAITVAVAERIIRSVWFERPPHARPHKFVVLLDADGKHPEDVIAPIHADLPSRLRDIDASIQFAWAQQHLEAWYFAEAKGLRISISAAAILAAWTRPNPTPSPTRSSTSGTSSARSPTHRWWPQKSPPGSMPRRSWNAAPAWRLHRRCKEWRWPDGRQLTALDPRAPARLPALPKRGVGLSASEAVRERGSPSRCRSR